MKQRYRIEALDGGKWRAVGYLTFAVPSGRRRADAALVVALPVDRHGKRLPRP